MAPAPRAGYLDAVGAQPMSSAARPALADRAAYHSSELTLSTAPDG